MENHKFRETQKEITIPKMMDSFLTSKTYMIIMDFIRILQDSAKGKKKVTFQKVRIHVSKDFLHYLMN